MKTKTFQFPHWDTMPQEQKAIVIELLKVEGLISADDKVAEGIAPSDLGEIFCKIACKSAQAIAISACDGNPVCIAIAIAAGEECHAGC